MAWQNVLLSPNIKQHNKPKSPQAFLPFPWEKPSDEELAEKAQKYRLTDAEVVELNKILETWENSQKSKKNGQDRRPVGQAGAPE